MMNWLKNLMLFTLLILVIWLQKTDYNTKINEIGKKITDHNQDKYIATPKFNKLTAKKFAPRLAQANLATKSDIANSVNEINFDEKLKNLNLKVTSSKIKHLLVANELKYTNIWFKILYWSKITLIMMEQNFT